MSVHNNQPHGKKKRSNKTHPSTDRQNALLDLRTQRLHRLEKPRLEHLAHRLRVSREVVLAHVAQHACAGEKAQLGAAEGACVGARMPEVEAGVVGYAGEGLAAADCVRKIEY